MREESTRARWIITEHLYAARPVLILFGACALCLVPCSCEPASFPLPSLPDVTRVPALWYGVSSSPYQTEDPACQQSDGSCFQTDWELFDAAGRVAISKGNATWSYTETQRDVAALKWLGVTHYRFGIEWARVEPRPGEYDPEAVRHYVDLARQLHSEGIVPVVCLWHFSFPSWLADFEEPSRHGWLHPLAMERWVAYVELMAERLAPYVYLYVPQNEPSIQSLAAFAAGSFPPGQGSLMDLYALNTEVAAQAFIEAAVVIRQAYQEYAGDGAPAVRILSLQALTYWERDSLDLFGAGFEMAQDLDFGHLDMIQDHVDIVGFTYYTREYASALALLTRSDRTGAGVSDTGWRIYPEGLTAVIASLDDRYGKPVVILENGIADAGDTKRPAYILSHLAAIQAAIDQGHEVLGYFHWSLVDNYEWQDGYGPRFGLHTMDPETRVLQPKASAYLYRDMIQARGKLFSLSDSEAFSATQGDGGTSG